MIGTFFKAVVITVIVLAITAGLGLVIMAGVAGTHDVKPVPVPPDSGIASLAEQWDYGDAFHRPMEFNSYRNIDQVVDNIPFKGDDEVHRSNTEVVYAGTLPGINYQIAYSFDRDNFPPSVTLVSAYRIKDGTGRYFWKLWKPIHRCLAPYLLDRLAERAPG